MHSDDLDLWPTGKATTSMINVLQKYRQRPHRHRWCESSRNSRGERQPDRSFRVMQQSTQILGANVILHDAFLALLGQLAGHKAGSSLFASYIWISEKSLSECPLPKKASRAEKANLPYEFINITLVSNPHDSVVSSSFLQNPAYKVLVLLVINTRTKHAIMI